MAKQPALIATFVNGTTITRKSYTREYTHCWLAVFTFNQSGMTSQFTGSEGKTLTDTGFTMNPRSAAAKASSRWSNLTRQGLGVASWEMVEVKREGVAQ